MKSWFEVKNMSNDVLNVSIHDEIGMYGVSANDFMKMLSENEQAKSINLSVHSPGGSVLDGLAIYNSLKSHSANVYGYVAGIAASAASFVLMASDNITMPENSFLMIHNANGMAIGDAEEMRDTADVIEKLQNTILNIYVNKTGIKEEKLSEMMKAETWISADEAVSMGFADTISDRIEAVAKAKNFNKHFKNMPFKNKFDVNDIKNIKEFEKHLRDSGAYSKAEANRLASRAKVIFRNDNEKEQNNDLTALNNALMRFKIS